MAIINGKEVRGYKLVKDYGIITVMSARVTYRMKCEGCRCNRKSDDPSVFADWVRTDSGALCVECAGKVGGG